MSCLDLSKSLFILKKIQRQGTASFFLNLFPKLTINASVKEGKKMQRKALLKIDSPSVARFHCAELQNDGPPYL